MGFPAILANRIWHTTTQDRYASIINSGFILPEPDLPDKERWGSAMGAEYYPFVRSLGGISLFDFRGFDEDKYEMSYPNSSWREFVPCRSKNSSAIWIEINLPKVMKQFIDGSALIAKWKESNKLHRKIMPVIEAAHIGPISISAFGEVLTYQKNTNEFGSFQ